MKIYFQHTSTMWSLKVKCTIVKNYFIFDHSSKSIPHTNDLWWILLLFSFYLSSRLPNIFSCLLYNALTLLSIISYEFYLCELKSLLCPKSPKVHINKKNSKMNFEQLKIKYFSFSFYYLQLILSRNLQLWGIVFKNDYYSNLNELKSYIFNF